MAINSPPLVVHVIYALTIGGLENGLVNIINRMPSGSYRHAIICITVADEFAQRITAEDVSIFELNKREGHDVVFYWRLWKLFRALSPDIIHSRNLAALETQLFSIGCWGVKRVHGEHGREADDLDGSNLKYLVLRKFMRVLVHRYVAVSQDLERWLVELVKVAPGKLRQIYNGVDHERFAPAKGRCRDILPSNWHEEPERLIIGTVGRLNAVKDQRSLLCAVAHLRDTAPALFQRVRIMIVGDGPLRQSLATTAYELGLEAITWFPGDRNDVSALLAQMDVFVLPSLAEGISNTILEAMASGLPVIATAVGGNTELVEEGFNGSLIPVSDPEALARALRPLLEDEELRTRQGANARQRVCQRFDWQRTVGAYLGVYDELLQLPAGKRIGITG